ncbi:MAG TPA: polynucleotide 5'-hydroxyl-kinase [bacterium]|nr:polynucleotide 5'-hydroxyl-kinase [bacterium]
MAGAIVGSPGIVMMLGATDVGKTTTATRLAGAAVRAGVPAAVVDGDTGQSDLGPPAAVGWGPVHGAVRRMAGIPLAGLWFVGDTSPQRVYRHLVEGALALTACARRQGAQIVIVDTTGWIEGAGAAAKLRKIRRLAPRHLVAIQRDREVEPILAHVPRDTVVHRLRPAPAVRRRSAEERRALREAKFGRYFDGSALFALDADDIALQRDTIYRGRWIPPSRVLAEVPPDALRYLLVGLADRRGTIMAMGTVADVDPAQRRIAVVAPPVPPRAVRFVQWGVLRVTPAGREAGRLSDVRGASA